MLGVMLKCEVPGHSPQTSGVSEAGARKGTLFAGAAIRVQTLAHEGAIVHVLCILQVTVTHVATVQGFRLESESRLYLM